MVMYKIYNSEDGDSGLTVVMSDGSVHQLSGENACFKDVAQVLLTTPADEVDEEELLRLMQPALLAGRNLTRLSERVTFDGTNLLFDNDVIDAAIADHILRIIEEGGNPDSYKALVAFLEKLYTNPSKESRDNLYQFIINHNITIDPDGDFYAYKGVKADGTSVFSGFGIVDGVSMNGHLPNKPGSILEMPRSQVVSDSSIYCGIGLHAGSYNYARGHAQGILLLVKINPRDVVSVPTDANCAKMRTCRYKVVTQTQVQNMSTTATVILDTANDEDEISEVASIVDGLVENLKDGDNIVLNFTYTRGNGTDMEVELTLNDIRQGGKLLHGKNADGEPRSFRVEHITDLYVTIDDAEYVKALSPAEEKEANVDFIASRLLFGNKLDISFDYTTAKGEARVVKNFIVEALANETSQWKMFVGVREDGETRNYRSDRMENIVLNNVHTR